MSETKECPQCAEQVKFRARICRFCGYSFPAAASAPQALELDLTDTATVVFQGRIRGGDLEPTNLRMYFFRPDEKRYTEIKPRAVAGNNGWQPVGEEVVAQPGAGRRAMACAHTVYSTDSRKAGVDTPVQLEFLLGTGRLEIGWASMMTRQDGVLMLDPTGCGSVPVILEAGQVLVIDIGPILGHRGRDGYADLGYCGPPGTTRREPVVHLSPADAAAHAARWSSTTEVPPPPGKRIDPMLVVSGPMAQQRWGHGGSVFQADAEASGAALGAKLGAMYVEKKRKKALLEGARTAVEALVETAGLGECALLDGQIALRDNFSEVSSAATAALTEAEAVLAEWDQLTGVIASRRSEAGSASAAILSMAPQLGSAIRAALDQGEAVAGTEDLISLDGEVQRLKDEHAALNNATGFFAKAKAAAQQLAIKAQLTLAENKRDRAQFAAAKALLDSGAEASVPGAGAVIEAITGARTRAEEAAAQLAEAEAQRAAATPALAERLDAPMPTDGPASVVSERRSALERMSADASGWLHATTNALIQAGPDSWPADGALRAALDDHATKVALS